MAQGLRGKPMSMPPLEGFVELGAIAYGRAAIRERVVSAWDDFLRVAEGVDLDAKSRLPGWRAQEICVHLGAWPEHQPVNGVLAAAREVLRGNAPDAPPDPDDVNSSVVKTHRDASRDEVMGALRWAREQAADYLEGDEPRELDEVPVVSTVGPLPTLTILHAQIYELAVHGLDLQALGGPQPGRAPARRWSRRADRRDGSAGGAGRHREHGRDRQRGRRVGVPLGTATAGRSAAGGRVPERRKSDFAGKLPVRVHAPAATLLEASAARINPLKAVLTRRLKVHGLPGLLGLAPIVETVPGIPGGGSVTRRRQGAGRRGRRTRPADPPLAAN